MSLCSFLQLTRHWTQPPRLAFQKTMYQHRLPFFQQHNIWNMNIVMTSPLTLNVIHYSCQSCWLVRNPFVSNLRSLLPAQEGKECGLLLTNCSFGIEHCICFHQRVCSNGWLVYCRLEGCFLCMVLDVSSCGVALTHYLVHWMQVKCSDAKCIRCWNMLHSNFKHVERSLDMDAMTNVQGMDVVPVFLQVSESHVHALHSHYQQCLVLVYPI